jgi:hypothetical protein
MELIETSTFLNLTKTEQVILVIQKGEEVLTREEDKYSIHLFVLSNLFVELWYAKNSNKILKTRLSDREMVINEYATIEDNVQDLLSKKKALS